MSELLEKIKARSKSRNEFNERMSSDPEWATDTVDWSVRNDLDLQGITVKLEKRRPTTLTINDPNKRLKKFEKAKLENSFSFLRVYGYAVTFTVE